MAIAATILALPDLSVHLVEFEEMIAPRGVPCRHACAERAGDSASPLMSLAWQDSRTVPQHAKTCARISSLW